MKFDAQKHQPHSIRLKGYDYSQSGGYVITIVTYQPSRAASAVNSMRQESGKEIMEPVLSLSKETFQSQP